MCLLDEWFSRLVVGGGVGPSLVSTTLLTHHYQSHNHNHKTHISTHTYQHPAPVRACASVCLSNLPYESRPLLSCLLWSLGWSVLWSSSWGLYLSCCQASPSPSYTTHTQGHTSTHHPSSALSWHTGQLTKVALCVLSLVLSATCVGEASLRGSRSPHTS